MNLIRKFKSIVYCNLFYHEGFSITVDGAEYHICETCRKSFRSIVPEYSLAPNEDTIEDKENKVLTWYLDKTSGMVDNPKKLKPEDFQLIKICHPELEEYSKLWRVF